MNKQAKLLFTRGIPCALAASSWTLVFPIFAYAEEEEGGGISAILPDMNEFIPMLIAFIVLAILLWKFGWPMFENMLSKRETTIREALEKSEQMRAESERVLAQYQQQLADAKTQSQQIVAEAKKTGDALKDDITAKAQAEAQDMIAKARVAIEAEKKSAISELQSSVADTSISLASRLIGENLSDEEHRKIIERYINEAGSFNAS